MKHKDVRKVHKVDSMVIIVIIIFLSLFFIEIFNHPVYEINTVMLILGFVWIVFTVPVIGISNLYLYKFNIIDTIKWGVSGLIMYGAFIFFTFWLGSLFALGFPFSALSAILGPLSFLSLLVIIYILFQSIKKKELEEIREVKKTIIDLGTRFTRLKVVDLAEKCRVDQHTITNTIIEMIKGNEIYADYFQSSKSVSFNQQANIQDIDNLMIIYSKWEETKSGKKA